MGPMTRRTDRAAQRRITSALSIAIVPILGAGAYADLVLETETAELGKQGTGLFSFGLQINEITACTVNKDDQKEFLEMDSNRKWMQSILILMLSNNFMRYFSMVVG